MRVLSNIHQIYLINIKFGLRSSKLEHNNNFKLSTIEDESVNILHVYTQIISSLSLCTM